MQKKLNHFTNNKEKHNFLLFRYVRYINTELLYDKTTVQFRLFRKRITKKVRRSMALYFN